ncbi:TPA: hypothetical protein QB189_001613 [Pasteurella multocida]|nr:hypothetical protein [Pasteurella multocida]
MEKHSSEKLNTICKKIKTTFEKLNIARIILVLSFAVFSYCILHYLAYSDEPIIDVLKSKIDDSRGLWTLITAIITAPIAFISQSGFSCRVLINFPVLYVVKHHLLEQN